MYIDGMPAEVYIKDKRTGIVYGPGLENDMGALDDLLRSDLGFEPDESSWLAGWMNWFGQPIALNVPPARLNGDVAARIAENRACPDTQSLGDAQYQVFMHLKAHFTWTNNWGRKISHYPPLS